MKKMKNTIKAGLGLGALAISQVALAAGSSSNFTRNNDAGSFNYGGQTLDKQITSWISYLTGFLLLVAVVSGLYWAFNILTAAGDEDKVKTGKSIIIRACLGLVAVFSIYMIMSFVISSLFSTGASS